MQVVSGGITHNFDHTQAAAVDFKRQFNKFNAPIYYAIVADGVTVMESIEPILIDGADKKDLLIAKAMEKPNTLQTLEVWPGLVAKPEQSVPG